MSRSLLVCLSAIVVATSVRGQGFTNLNFESAQVTSRFVATTSALPGWSTFVGTNQFFFVDYNPQLNDGPGTLGPVDLLGSNADVIAGSFSVLLDGGTINQSGVVPSGSESLVFDAFSPFGGSPSLSLSLGGQNLSYEEIGSGTNPYGNHYTIYGTDISTFAGQMETLTFSGNGILDDIQFSPEAIPEPSTASLFSLGGGILFYVCRFRKRLRFTLIARSKVRQR